MSTDRDVLRGDEAARAQRIDLVAAPLAAALARPALNPTGPWAADVDSAFAQAREEGFAVGRQQGWEVGLTQGLAEAREEAARHAAAIEVLGRRVEQELARATARVADEATGLALAVARAVLARELACATDPGADAIARCLATVSLAGPVTAHLNPDDLERLGPVPDLGDRALTLVPDPTVASGDAVVTVDDTLIDSRLDEALARVIEVLP